MSDKQSNQEIKRLLTAFRERVENPRVQMLNQDFRNERRRKKQDIRTYYQSLEELGLDSEKLIKDWEKGLQEANKFRNQKIPAIPKWINSAHKDCKDKRVLLQRNQNQLGPYHIFQPEMLTTNVYSNQRLNTLDPLPSTQGLFDTGRLRKADSLWPEPFNIYAQSNNSIDGTTDVEERNRQYHFMAPEEVPQPVPVILKWDSFGLYWIYSTPSPHYNSYAELSITADVYFLQKHGGAYWPTHLRHEILALNGHQIAQSDWLSGTDGYVLWYVYLFPNTYTLSAAYVTFKTYSIYDAFAIIDCDGSSVGMDFWYNFNLLAVM
jgi:hypothetical protein